jgi:hypothetical protein
MRDGTYSTFHDVGGAGNYTPVANFRGHARIAGKPRQRQLR